MTHLPYYFILPVKSFEKVEIQFIHNMLQWEEISFKCKIHFVIFFIVLIRLTTCGAVITNAVIGEKVILNFEYPCDSTKITLQHSYRPPFYHSHNPSAIPLPANYLLENKNDTARNECSLHLTINPVSRDDAGTYILIAYKNGFILPDYPRILLGVDYPPGKASCELSNDYNDGEWVSLRCTAPVGTLPGQIACYQNETKLPQWNSLAESGGNLNQIILATLDDVVYCCSSILTGMKDKCDCTDWGWDPLMSDNVFDIADPCPQVMSTEDPTSTHIVITDSIISSSSNLVTALTKYPENHKNTSYWIVTCGMVIFIWTIITFIIKYRCKAKELESTDPCLPPVYGEELLEHNV